MVLNGRGIVRLQGKPGRDTVVRKEQGLRGRRPSRRKEECEAAGRGGVGLLLILDCYPSS